VQYPSHAVKRGFTLIEVLTVLAITSMLAAMLLPTFSRARESGRRASCASNMRQIGMAMQMYADDNDEVYSSGGTENFEPIVHPIVPFIQYWCWWGELIFPYTKSDQVFHCPSARDIRVPDDPSIGPRDNLAATTIETWSIGGVLPGSGGGDGIGGPPVPKHEAQPIFYSYAMNAIGPTDVRWQNSPDTPPGRHGFRQNFLRIEEGPTFKVFFREPIGVHTVAVAQPAETIMIVDAARLTGEGLIEPAISSDAQLDYAPEADPPVLRVADRHLGGYNALFADGHTKWIKFGSSRPAQWTVQDD